VRGCEVAPSATKSTSKVLLLLLLARLLLFFTCCRAAIFAMRGPAQQNHIEVLDFAPLLQWVVGPVCLSRILTVNGQICMAGNMSGGKYDWSKLF
jgi:hypothetical protein